MPGNNDTLATGSGGGDMVREQLRRAQEGGQAPDDSPRPTVFFGGDHTLGSDDAPSSFTPDSNAISATDSDQVVLRYMTFWKNGFQVEDGELMRYDDPENTGILEAINSGRAPPSIFSVLDGQLVEVRVAKRINEDYPNLSRQSTSSGRTTGSPKTQRCERNWVLNAIKQAWPFPNLWCCADASQHSSTSAGKGYHEV